MAMKNIERDIQTTENADSQALDRATNLALLSTAGYCITSLSHEAAVVIPAFVISSAAFAAAYVNAIKHIILERRIRRLRENLDSTQ